MKRHDRALKAREIGILMCIFIVGWLANSLYLSIGGDNIEQPVFSSITSNAPLEIPSPSDHIKRDQIHVFSDRIVIDLPGASWAEFTDTNSMDPILDADANSFEIKPRAADQVSVGDIISYTSKYASGLIVHRVVETGEDSEGWYCRVKGDNLAGLDPGKIRFEQINGVLVGVIY